MERLRLAIWAAASVTLTVNVEVPVPVGVPEITPPVLIVSPAGSEPAVMLNVYGRTPPVAAMLAEYAEFCVPLFNEDVVIVTGVGLMVSESERVAVCAAASVTWTVNVAVPTTLGVPEIAPAVLNDSPVGSAPTVTVHV